MTPLRIGTFTRSVLIDIARDHGYFTEVGLAVEEVSVASSPAQFSQLLAGELDLVLTGPDNVVAYQFVADNPLGQVIDLTIYAAIDRGLGLGLWLGPGRTAADLRHQNFGVDVATSGFAFVGFALAERAGVAREELTVVALGSTPKRVTALAEGTCVATVLNASNELRAEAFGATCAGVVGDLGPYVGTVLAGRRGEHVASARQLRDALLRASAFLASDDHTTEVLERCQQVLGLDDEQARAHLAVMRSHADGVITNGRCDRSSLATVLTLRGRYLGLPTDATVEAFAGLVDAGYVE
jgi:ABC-type nitrate/sulfonate/bicarbonate transport system substrate-binding protein